MSPEITGEAGLVVEDGGDGVRVMRLDRPARLNALSWELVDELWDAVHALRRTAGVRAVVLAGSGRGFCSGLDLQRSDDPTGAATPMVEFMGHQERLAEVMAAIRSSRVPFVAAVNGPAAGGGLALALACDLRVAAPSARFVVAFLRLGLSACDMGVSYLLPRLVGLGTASDMMLTGRALDAAEAHRVGLVQRLAGQGEVVEVARELATRIATQAPYGVGMTKEVLRFNADAPSLEAAIALENRTQAVASRTADHEEAVHAFVERREPAFRGM